MTKAQKKSSGVRMPLRIAVILCAAVGLSVLIAAGYKEAKDFVQNYQVLLAAMGAMAVALVAYDSVIEGAKLQSKSALAQARAPLLLDQQRIEDGKHAYAAALCALAHELSEIMAGRIAEAQEGSENEKFRARKSDRVVLVDYLKSMQVALHKLIDANLSNLAILGPDAAVLTVELCSYMNRYDAVVEECVALAEHDPASDATQSVFDHLEKQATSCRDAALKLRDAIKQWQAENKKRNFLSGFEEFI